VKSVFEAIQLVQPETATNVLYAMPLSVRNEVTASSRSVASRSHGLREKARWRNGLVISSPDNINPKPKLDAHLGFEWCLNFLASF
jgi:hypothetical protein